MQARIRAVLVAAGLFALAAPAGAQTDHAHLGVHVLRNTTFDDWGLGGQLSLPIARHLELYPSFDYYFEPTGSKLWAGNLDIKYRASGHRYDWLYVGAGLNYSYQSFDDPSYGHDDRVGMNLFGGVESLRGKIHPFGEARVTVADRTRFQIQAGLNVTLGSGGG